MSLEALVLGLAASVRVEPAYPGPVNVAPCVRQVPKPGGNVAPQSLGHKF